MRRLVVTFICENRHNVESITIDLSRRDKELTEDDIWQLLSREIQCKKCGSRNFIYRTRYKD